MTDFEDLTAYTEPRYADGARVITSLTGARRILPDGRVVAAFGDQSHIEMAASRSSVCVEQTDARTIVVIRRPIRADGDTIGYDVGAFDTSLLHDELPGSLSGVSIHAVPPSENDSDASTGADRNTHTVALNNHGLYLAGTIEPSLVQNTHRQALQQVALYVLVTALAVLVLLRLTLFRFIHTLIRDLSRASADKDLLLRESHHRIKNNFAVVESFLHLQSTTAPNADTSEALQTASSRITNMRLLYERLLETDSHTTVALRDYLKPLAEHVVSVYQHEKQIDLQSDIDELSLDAERGFALGAIVTELLTNSLKHGYADGSSGTVKVSLTHVDSDAILTICDDGRGLPPDIKVADSDSFGLTVVRMLAEQLGGTFSFDTQQGQHNTCFRVVFPLRSSTPR